ncbi:MAG: hypothetical protein JSV53_06870 [candidate division WOR-3 bacterium]|nr:MAG: hypothetical protein JSV53_06870 [candidate division WOR-3 bacterium]
MGLTPSCDTIQSFYISNAESIQELPDVCFGLGNYVAVWTDFRNGVDRMIRTARITPQWAVLDTGSVIWANSIYQITPVIAFDGTRYLAAWQNIADPFGIHCRFIGADGLPQDSGITISTAPSATNPRICYDGVNYLVVWQEYTTTNNIIGQFISPGGALIGDTIVVTSGAANHVAPALCHDGNQFLVVWAETQIWGQVVSGTGNLVGAPFQVSGTQYEQVDPDVFFGGGKFLAIWSEFRTDYDIYGNLDIQIGVQDSNYSVPSHPKFYADKTIFIDRVNIIGGRGVKISVFDILGNKVTETINGVWEAQSSSSGVYFLSANGQVIRVVKVK